MDKHDKSLIIWWAALVALTLLSFETSMLSHARDAAVALVIVIAMLKVRIVILHFMEVRVAPAPLRVALEIWIVAIGVAILSVWFAAPPP